jgi:hypothetical protein
MSPRLTKTPECDALANYPIGAPAAQSARKWTAWPVNSPDDQNGQKDGKQLRQPY